MIQQPKLQNFLLQLNNLDLSNYFPNVRPAKLFHLLKNGDTKDNIILLINIISIKNLLSANVQSVILQTLQSDQIWNKLNYNQQFVLTSQIIELSYSYKQLLNSLFGLIVKGIKVTSDEGFGQFRDKIFNYFASADIDYVEFGLKILRTIYQQSRFQKQDEIIANIIDSVLQYDNENLKNESVDMLNQIIVNLDHNSMQKYVFLLPKIFKLCLIQIQYYNQDTILQKLRVILQQKSRFIYAQISKFIQMLNSIYYLSNFNNKRQIVEILQITAVRYPSYFTKNQNALLLFLKIILLQMIKINQCQNQWLAPNQNIQHQISQIQQAVRYGLEVIDNIFLKFKGQKWFGSIKYAVSQLDLFVDWKYKYVGILAFSQISSYIQKSQYIKQIIQFILPNMSHIHPKIRYACFQSLNIILQDHRQFVKKNCLNIILQKIQIGLNDSVVRVKSEAFQCLNQILPLLNIQKMQPFLNSIYQICLENLLSPVNILIIRVIRTFQFLFSVKCSELIKLDYTYLLAAFKQLYNNSVFYSVRSSAVSAIIQLVSGLKSEQIIYNYIPDIQNYLISEMQCINMERIGYYIQMWIRLMDRFDRYILLRQEDEKKLIKGGFESVLVQQSVVQQNRQYNGYEFLCRLIDRLGRKSIEFYDIIEQNVDKFVSKQIKNYNIFLFYAKILRKIKQNETQQLFYHYYQKYSNKLHQYSHHSQMAQYYHHNLPKLLQTKLQILKLYPSQNIQSINFHIQLIKQLALQSLQHYHQKISNPSSQQPDQQQIAQNHQSLKIQSIILDKILQITYYLLSNYNTLSLNQLLIFILQKIIKRCYDSIYQELKLQAILILDDLIEKLQYQKIQKYILPYIYILIQNLINSSHPIRQASAYGVALWIKKQKSLKHQFDIVSKIYKNCMQALQLPIIQQQEIAYYWALDNLVCILGNLINTDISLEVRKQLLWLWFDHLPLNEDIQQGHDQYLLLLKLGYDKTLVREQNEIGLRNMLNILRIISKIYGETQISNDNIDEEICKFVKELYKDSFIGKNLDYFWTNLDQNEKIILSRIQATTNVN